MNGFDVKFVADRYLPVMDMYIAYLKRDVVHHRQGEDACVVCEVFS